jgi:hypothetical protein
MASSWSMRRCAGLPDMMMAAVDDAETEEPRLRKSRVARCETHQAELCRERGVGW